MTAEENGKRFMMEMAEKETKKIVEKLDIIIREGESIRISAGNKAANRVREIAKEIEEGMKKYIEIIKYNNFYVTGEGCYRSNKYMAELRMLEYARKYFKNKELLMSVI